MATEQQIQAMLDAMKTQMDQVTRLQEENAQLRTLVAVSYTHLTLPTKA